MSGRGFGCYGESMSLFAQIVPNTAKAAMLFAAACILACVAGGTVGRILVRLVVELPLLVLLGLVAALVINAVVAAGGTVLGRSVWWRPCSPQ